MKYLIITILSLSILLTGCKKEEVVVENNDNKISTTIPNNTEIKMRDLEYNEDNLKTFVNTEYRYSFEYPAELKIVAECYENQDPTKCFTVNVLDITLNSTLKSRIDLIDINVREIDMNAIEFAQKSIELEEYCDENDLGYIDKKEVLFNNIPAYEYKVTKNFGEGNVLESIELNKNDCRVSTGWLLDGFPNKVIYFNKNDYLWRVIYPLENKASEIIINSFKFLD
ncbi:hypothetical protein KAI92_04690 [Candidatus Parcubacteria bacterium]|nr:hypothetical protein [Candidatus Parcubacteria bacterium]